MKRQIEIDDTLQERVEQTKLEVKEQFDEIAKENPDYDGDDIYQKICDFVVEIVDSNTPIYRFEIDGLHYLYGGELEEAYEDAGCYDKQSDNYRQVCIYFYLEAKAHEYLEKLQVKFEEATNNETGD
jgi:hypothetical protein